jgi:tRNA A-37 threonylcarbamoyl transferase component Bud32
MPLPDATSSPKSQSKPHPNAPGEAAQASALAGEHTWVDRTRGNWQWRIRCDWAAYFDSPAAPDWLNLHDQSGTVRVKTNEIRQVWLIETPSGSLYAKIAGPGRKWPRLRRLLLGPDALREWRVADYAARHRIATVAPVAAGWAKVNGQQPASVLITMALVNARPLDSLWLELDPARPATRRIKNAAIDATAELVARAHQNGFVHADLHAGNVLIESLPDDRCRACFVDLQSVRLHGPVSDGRVFHNLGQLNQWFQVNGLVSDRIRFLVRYLDWRNRVLAESAHGRRLAGDLRSLLGPLEQAARLHNRALAAKRDRQSMRDGRYFAAFRLEDGSRAHVFLEAKHPLPGSPASSMRFTREQWRDRLTPPRDWMNTTDLRNVIKDSDTALTCTARLAVAGGPCLKVVCKRTSPRRLHKRLLYLFLRSREMRSWKLGNALLHRQVATARPLAVCETRRWGLLRDSLLVTEFVEHAQDLDTLLVLRLREMPSDQQRRLKARIIRSLARLVRTMDDAGLAHRDLKASNILVQLDPQERDRPRLLLVDLDGLSRRRLWRPNSRLRALARLNASLEHCRRLTRTDRVRFLRDYLNSIGPPRTDWKTLWRQVARQSLPGVRPAGEPNASLLDEQ